MQERNILVFDAGSTYTKVSAFRVIDDSLIFEGRAQAPTTIEDIQKGIDNAEKNLSDDYAHLGRSNLEIFSSSSAAGGLRMVAMGYMPRVTVKAAKEVAMNAGARVLEIMSQEDHPEFRLQILEEIKPDIILLAGGTDGGDKESAIDNAKIIAKSSTQAMVIIACNIEAQADVEAILISNNIKTIRVPNVMPTIHELKVKPAREAIHDQFIKQITKAKGLHKLLNTVTSGKIVPTPGAVLLATEMIAKGLPDIKGIGETLVIDIGGATTDIHSVLPELEKLNIEELGLIVTNEKQVSYRTVEGNLGLRVSALGIVETATQRGVLARVGVNDYELEEKLQQYAAYLESNPEHISYDSTEKLFDKAMAITAIEYALKRHAGYFAQEYDPIMGVIPGTPIGRDLRRVTNVIAVGGIFKYSTEEESMEILKTAFKEPGISLLPVKPKFFLDKEYILYSLGVMANKYPVQIVKFAKLYFNIVNNKRRNDR